LLCVVGLFGVPHGEPDAETGKPNEVRAATAEKLKGEFEPKPTADHPTTDADVTVLPAFEIFGSSKSKDPRSKLRGI
jgi:hypothetical protein